MRKNIDFSRVPCMLQELKKYSQAEQAEENSMTYALPDSRGSASGCIVSAHFRKWEMILRNSDGGLEPAQGFSLAERR